MKKKYGEDKIFMFRRSWDVPPGPLNKNNPYHPKKPMLLDKFTMIFQNQNYQNDTKKIYWMSLKDTYEN